ncbi:MAG: hypothetical protein ACRC1U_04060, partial [Vibrionaceae bacterium]
LARSFKRCKKGVDLLSKLKFHCADQQTLCHKRLFILLYLVVTVAFLIGILIAFDLHARFAVTGYDIRERRFRFPLSFHRSHSVNAAITAIHTPDQT